MKNVMKTTLTLASAIVIMPIFSFAEDSKSIYGADNRKDYFEMPPQMQALSDSVVSFWEADSIETLNPGGVKLKTMNFGEYRNLCPDVKFREQPIGAYCSGSLVGEDLVLTAGHCVKDEAGCAAAKIVFGYKIQKEGEAAVTAMPASEVYGCSRIIKRFLAGDPGMNNPTGQNLGPDFALIKLGRKVTGHKPLPVDRGPGVKNGYWISVLGHPVGLPVKLAYNATVRDASKVGYFVANLDTFGGNSGSPVFGANNKIVGVLVRGDEDFMDSPAGCTAMATFDFNGGRGEDVTKISAISADIPKLPGERGYALQEALAVDSSAIGAGEIAPSRVISFD